ncbi:sigma-70 family RNA polymerase sigma factor [Paenibacillus thermoaerophilus]|uniref:Sigma-70 family RNA polymerase sigma factor n=1 Tax=Paenibacillus thermoaerophilus TaxID=1215385 RepID=A0ABW2UZB8_9BACL|nr:sigma-70 family RNA polymerase sigma factor [Paenibacillus thermoaerophilus]TMV17418.1 sigma-70 family RNA polymerase sigma factor [Paenibacillus thermoaerophilus]
MSDSAPNLFRQIFELHYPSVRRKLVALVKDEAAAEDLAQEVFLKLYRHPPDHPGAIGGWLHRVLTRTAYDYLDRKTRERALIEKQEQHIQTLPDSHQDSEELVMRQADREQVLKWMEKLSERDREMLLLRYSGYSYSEIAERLKIRQTQVGTMLMRATERVRRHAMADAEANRL